MVIVIDTREQHPYSFTVPAVRRKLEAGDYSIEGFETVAAIERKELNDYVQTVIYQRERFAKELKKLAAFRLKAIVVEASMADVIAGRYEGHVPPKSVVGATAGIILGYGIPVYFCSDRQIALHFTETLLMKFHERQTGERIKK